MNPKGPKFLLSLASFIKDNIPAIVGAAADVPPAPEHPPYVHRGIPNCASKLTSGYALPDLLYVPSRLNTFLYFNLASDS